MNEVQRSAVDGMKWAIDCIETFESQCLLEEHTDTGELWDWIELLKDKARTLSGVVSG
jgi:hypothetical protein